MAERLHSNVYLPDGRRLSFAEYGDPDGEVVIYFHGTPGSHLECGRPDVDALFRKLGVRLIAPDRPGMGASDFQADRRLLDWPADVHCLAAAVGAERFAVLGVSGGGPYALACAYALPGEVAAVSLVSSLGPAKTLARCPLTGWGRLVFGLCRLNPVWLEAYLRGLTGLMRWAPEAALTSLNLGAPQPDHAILADPAARAQMIASVRLALAPGPRGVAWEIRLMAQPWGFPLEALATPIDLWHGEQDQTVPAAVGHWLAGALPHCNAHFLADAGHFLAVAHCAELLPSLLSLSRAGPEGARV